LPLVFYNTMTRRKEEFVPLREGEVRMYTCGPTVYDYAHIGNFRSYIFEDILRRYLKYRGYNVIQVMNLTDVDDKTIRDSRKKSISLAEHTEKYIEAFFEDIDVLRIEHAEYYPRATEHIGDMIEIVSGLLKKRYAYKGKDGSVYFRIDKFGEYGKLARITADVLRPGVTVRTDEYDKESIGDFALWKAWDEDDGEVFWDSPFGKGRPGWHIECSAMSMKYLGETFDIHTGGVDNIFPHHDNEIAQSEAYTGKPFVRYWLHAEHLIVEGRKMSKSLGNFYTLRDLLSRGCTGRQIRYLLMNSHYRQQLNFTFEGLEAAKNGLQRIDDFVARLGDADSSAPVGDVPEQIEMTKQGFASAMDDDLNISAALGSLYDLIRWGNRRIDEVAIGKAEASELRSFLQQLDAVLGLLPEGLEVDPEVRRLADERDNARKAKNWKLADEIRDKVRQMGYVLEDTPHGVRIKKVD
jgi:cysteinyl-tRNA synthetase